MMDGPYKVAVGNPQVINGPGGKAYYCRSEFDAAEDAKWANKVRALAIKECIKLVDAAHHDAECCMEGADYDEFIKAEAAAVMAPVSVTTSALSRGRRRRRRRMGTIDFEAELSRIMAFIRREFWLDRELHRTNAAIAVLGWDPQP